MSCLTEWRFDILDTNSFEVIDTYALTIQFPTRSMAEMVVANGINIYPEELRDKLFELAAEIDGFPDFNLVFAYYLEEETEVDYVANHYLLDHPADPEELDDISSDEEF